MVLSIGSQSPNFLGLKNFTAPDSEAVQPRSSNANISPQIISSDILEFSDVAFETLQRGIDSLKQADLSFARQRLQATQELVELTQSLLSSAGEDQRGLILNNTESIGQSLRSIATQLRQLFSGDLEGTTQATYTDELSLEFNYASLSIREETLEVNRNEDGLEIRRTVEQTQLVVAELQIERTQTLSVRSQSGAELSGVLNTGDQIKNILDDFRSLVEGFQSLVGGVLESFTADEIQPEVPVDVLEAFLEQFSQIGTDTA